MNLREIGEILGVSESRVSQLRAEALTMLRDGITSQYEPDAKLAPLSKRANTARREYTHAIATNTLHNRLAHTNSQGETHTHARTA